MTQKEAKQVACRIAAAECYHQARRGGWDESKTDEDDDRIRKALEELEDELERRGGMRRRTS